MKRLSILLLICGCSDVRFANRRILWTVHDDAPIPQPKEREALLYGPGARDELFRSADRVLDLDYGAEAVNVNALDEVPDSSWFEDPRRDHARDDARPRPLTEAEMQAGATAGDDPPVPPFVVHKAKTEGATAGFIVKDARGRKYALKLDPPGWPQLATSTELIATRLVWSLGWRVPKMWLIDLKPSDLVIADDATYQDKYFRKVKLTSEQLREMLGRIPIDDDHPVAALMSLWIPGKVIGPYSYFGRRSDDKNDYYPHEDRRDLRGFAVVSAWINNIDTQELNTLDTYIDRHVVHYQQDVGGSFGSRAVGPTDYWMGAERYFPLSNILLSFVTLGAVTRPWEGGGVLEARAREMARWPELGYFDAEHFNPRDWSPMVYNPAFDRATKRDRYWGAKRVIAMSANELRAAIATGRYRSDTAERLFDVLWKRREKIARAFLGDVASLDYFRVERGELCFDDLWEAAGLGAGSEVRVSGGLLHPGARCVVLPSARGYHIVSLRTRHPGERKPGPPVKVHLIDGNIVGVER